MKKIIILLIAFHLLANFSHSQYNMKTENGTTKNVCSGTFFDDGGSEGSQSQQNQAGNYGNGEDYSMTICPSTPGDLIKVNFTFFSVKETNGGTKSCEDWLYIFQGNAVTATPDDIYCGELLAPNLPVVLSTSPDGCITFQFQSSANGNRGGFVGNITCVTPCQNPIADLLDLSAINICPSSATIPGSLSISVDAGNSAIGSYDPASPHSLVNYDWEWGDGTSNTTATASTTHTYAVPGIYVVKLRVRDNNLDFSLSGCSSVNSITRIVRVLPEPDFTGTSASPQTVNCGDNVTITSIANSQTRTQSLPAVSTGNVTLPDGNGQSYTSGANYSGLFPSGATLAAGCYPTVTFNMEHSWARDLTIDLIAPNGATVRLFNRHGIPGNMQPSYKFGTCVNGADDGIQGCGTTYTVVNAGGSSWINYGTGAGQVGTTTPTSCGAWPTGTGICELGTYYKPGTYNSTTPFSVINGAPLNGIWTIKITDNQSLDDGTLFNWSLTFPNSCYAPLESVTPDLVTEIWSHSGSGPGIPAQNTTSTVVTDPGPDACPVAGTCVGNELTNSINLGPFNSNGSFDYITTVTDEFGCQFERTITLNVTCSVFATLSGATSICAGSNTTLTFSGTPNATVTYKINGGADLTIVLDGAGLATVNTGAINATTTYTLVSVTDGVTTIALSEDEIVTVNALPTVTSVTGAGTFCAGSAIGGIDVNVTGTAPWTIDYTLNGVAASVNGNTSPVSLGSAAGTYIVTNITDANCTNTASGTQTITVNTLPTVTGISGGNTYCAGDVISTIDVTVTGSTPWTINYTLDGVAQSVNGNVSPISLGNAAGTYVLTSVSDLNCSNTASGNQTITINALPAVTIITGGNAYCTGDVIANIEVEVTGTNDWSIDYTLDGTAQTANGAVSPISLGNAEGVYVVTAITDANCTNAANGTETIVINSLPTFIINGTDPTICGAADGFITISSLNNSTNYSISYDDDAVTVGPTVLMTDALGNIVIPNLNAGSYDNFIVSLNGCDGVDLLGTSLSNPGAPNITDISNQTFCAPNTFSLPLISGTNLTGNEGYFTASNGGGTQLNVGDVISSTQTIFIYDVNGACSDEENFVVTVRTLPTVTSISGGSVYCAGDVIANIEVVVTGSTPWTIDYTLDGVAQTASGPSSPISLGNAAGTYVVTNVADANCTNTANGTQTITINALPTVINITGGNTYCTGDAVANIEVAVTGTNDWTIDFTLDGVASSMIGSSSPISLGNASGVYVLTGISDANCTNTASGTQTIIVNTLPTVTGISGGNTYCAGDAIANIEVAVTGATPWTIDYTLDGVAQTASGPSSPISLGNAAGTYVVTNVADANCTNTANGTQTITINALPTVINITGGNTYCTGDAVANIEVAVTGTNDWTIDFTLDGVASSVTGSSSPISLGNAEGVYVLTNITDANCTTTATGTETISINEVPTVTSVSGGSVYCAGDAIANIEVAVTGSTPWSIDFTLDGVAQTASGASSPISLGNAAGTYVITDVTDANCTNTASGTETITINALPAVTDMTGGNNYCVGDAIANIEVAITGTNDWTIDFTLDGVASSVTGSSSPISLGNAEGVYVLTNITDANCTTTATGTETISINEVPTVTSVSGGGVYCAGDAVANIEVAVTGSTPWTIDYTLDGVAQTASGASSPISLGNSAGVYVLTNVTDVNCTNIANGSETITINSLPLVSAGNDQSVCQNSAVILSGSGAVSYTWNNGVLDGVSFNATTLGATVYTVTGIDGNNCQNTDQVTITASALPTVSAVTGGGTYCAGDQIANINATVTGAGPWTIDFTLNGTAQTTNGASSPISLGNAAGNYVITNVSVGTCTNTASGSESIVINPIPASPNVSSDTSYCSYEILANLTVSGEPTATFTWYNNVGLTSQVGTGTVLSPTYTDGLSVYYVTQFVNGCTSASNSISVTVNQCELIIPTAFTPDNDGVNDTWHIENLNNYFPNCNVLIYNRWGGLVFESKGYAVEWDGKYKESELPVGSYYFIVDFNDGKTEKKNGTVSILKNK